MTEPAGSQFLDVPTLLEKSQHRGLGVRMWQIIALFALLVMFSTYLGSRSSQAAKALNVISAVLMFGLMGTLALLSWITFRRARAEQLQLEAIEELIRLRRWPEAGGMLEQLLSRPTRIVGVRIQGLIFLAGVLARYNRFEDAIAVQNYLLEHVMLDGGTAHGLRLARAMAMLREDHLFDADRAINELRRQVTRAGRAMDQANTDEGQDLPEPQDPQSLSAGLALIEIYRDVKTGHPAEAIELFDSTLASLREQLGHRVADAYMLIAKAYDLLGREAEAARMYEQATLLSPAVELHRRYPETAALQPKYQPAPAPQGAM